jgi:PAS domain-containing protein
MSRLDDLISLLEETEKKYKEAQLRLDLAITATGIGIWDWNIHTNDLSWDDNMLMLFGMTREQFTESYDSFNDCLIPEDALLAKQLLKECIETRKPYDFSYRLRSRPGVTIRGRGKCFYIEDKPYRFIGVCLEGSTIHNLSSPDLLLTCMDRTCPQRKQIETGLVFLQAPVNRFNI